MAASSVPMSWNFSDELPTFSTRMFTCAARPDGEWETGER